MRRTIFIALGALILAAPLTPLAGQGAPQKAKPPAPLPLGNVEFPPFTERTLSRGAQLLVVENHEQPVVSVNIYIKGAGQVADTDAKPGVAMVTAALLEAGTRTRTSKQIAETIESLGANLSTGTTQEWATISATMLKEDVDQILGVIADVLLNSTFPEDELETERTRLLTDLQVTLSRPASLAQRNFEARVFGRHPYGRLLTTAGLRSITRADVVAFHQNNYKPSNALIVVAGDVDPSTVSATIEKHLGAWTGSGPARPQFEAAPALGKRQIVLVNKPGAVQAAYRIGHTIVPATHPDWPALTVAQQVLGGGSNAWLYEQLREKKGFTYGAYAQSTQRLDPGYFVMWGDVRNEVADSALELFLALAERLQKEPVPAADLELAKAWITGNFPLTIETPAQVAGQVATARLLGQPKDHLQTWRTRIAAVTATDVQRVAKAHLNPEHAVIVITGDASVLQPKLEKFAPVQVVDETGRPVEAAATNATQPPLSLDASTLQPQSLTYTVSMQGTQVAESINTVYHEKDAGRDIIRGVIETTGMMTGKSEVRFEAKTFRPLASTVSQQAAGNEVSILMTVADGKVSGTLSRTNQEPKVIDAPLPEGTLLGGMDEFAIWVADFSTVKELRLSLFSPMSGSVVPLTLKVVGEGKQKVPAGEFDVYELEMQTSQGAMKGYVRKTAPHIMIKQEFVTQPVVVELKSLQ